MTTEELKLLKENLEQQINDSIKKFEANTKVNVEDVKLAYVWSGKSLIQTVKVKIAL